MPNRLANERSPYLLQHANNPVDWRPWGDDAFEAARREDKPIFLSIGYSTCHWCHVMEHESFEDPAVAARLNTGFISIKVDREERPDIDRVYMTFVQATTGAGGWPMSVWLTPDLKPFFGGTYFPPTSRWGRPGFVDVLAEISRAWRAERARLIDSSNDIVERLRHVTGAAEVSEDRMPVADRASVDEGIAAFEKAFDRRHGGFGGAPKFPRPAELLFLSNAWALTADDRAKRMTLDTLRAMALGGVRDHVGGGFHRYSVDAEWRVPHFEKMLYDQAQLVLAYLDAAQMSGEPFYAAVAEDTLAYVARELTSPDGAFYSAEDADSMTAGGPGEAAESREGAFYVWTAKEIEALFGKDADVVRRHFGVEDAGNAPADPQGEFRGQNILYVAQAIDDAAARSGRTPEDVMSILAHARQELFTVRSRRARPHLDDKILTSWNGMMIAAFARAARVLVDSPRRNEWRDIAIRAARAIEALLWQPQKHRLLRRYRDGDAAIDAFCEDYACLVWGLLELVQTTGDVHWLGWARDLTAIQTERFFDERDGGWFSTTGEDRSVLLRVKEDYDGAEPSAASVTVRNLIVFSHLLSDTAFARHAERTLERYGDTIGQIVRVMPFMVANVALWRSRSGQAVIVGEPDAESTRGLTRVLASRYLPSLVVLPVAPGIAQQALSLELPWIRGMTTKGPAANAYVCQDFSCQAPTADPDQLARIVEDATAARRLV
jgi:hypothetical protein